MTPPETPDCNRDDPASLAPAIGSTAVEPIWCDWCRGRGQTFVKWDWSNGYEEEITERCECCNGRGHFDDDDDEQ